MHNQPGLWGDSVSAPAPRGERERDALRKRASRAESRDIEIPPVADPARRERCRDPLLFGPTYFPHYCYLPMCQYHEEIIATTAEIMLHGGCDADAEPRGIGKTTTLEIMSLWGILYGVVDLLGYAAASHPEAIARLSEIIHELQENERLAADFPEFVVPFRELSGNAQRAKGQTVNGQLTGISMTGDRIVFPSIDGTRAHGQCIITRGVESGLRGAKHNGTRPQFWLVDDPQTREVARSIDKQVPKIIDTIQRDIIRGGDNRQKIACKALVTIIFEGDVADQLTDRDKHPEWNGKRKKLLIREPDNTDLWDEYIKLYRDDQKDGDRYARRAHQYYLANRAAMDAGSEVAWDQLYYGRHMDYKRLIDAEDEDAMDIAEARSDEREKTMQAVLASQVSRWMSKRFRDIDDQTAASLKEVNVLPDGTEMEASALQHCFNIIAEQGRDVFRSECQNEPVAVEGVQDELSPDLIASRLSRLKRRQIPAACDHLVAFIDVHKTPLYWLVLALENGYPGYVIDYGTYPKTPGAAYTWSGDELMRATKTDSVEASIHQGLDDLADLILRDPWKRDDGVELPVERCLIDSGWGPQTETVYRWCVMSGLRSVAYPSKGKFVRDNVGANLAKGKRKARHRRGLNWVQGPAPGNPKVRLVSYDSGWWKTFCHARLAAPVGDHGSISLFGNDPRAHGIFATQLTSEYVRTSRSVSGESLVWTLRPGRHDNHYLDCLAGACCAGSMVGVQYDTSGTSPGKKKRAKAKPRGHARKTRKQQRIHGRSTGGIRTNYG